MNQNVTILKSVTLSILMRLTTLISEFLIMLKKTQVCIVALAQLGLTNTISSHMFTQVIIYPICCKFLRPAN